MAVYNSFQDHEETKKFEAYLLIKSRIVSETTSWVQEILEKLQSVYESTGKEEDLMEVLRWARK